MGSSRGGRREHATGDPAKSARRLSVVLAGVLGASVALLGGAHFQTAALVAGLGALVLCTQWQSLRAGWGPVPTVCSCLACWTAASLVPIPAGLLQLLSPSAFSFRQGVAQAAGQGLSWAPLSLDPTASSLEAAKWALYALIAAASGRLASLSSLRHVLAIVWGLGSAVSLVTMAQALTGLTSVLGVYETPTVTDARLVSVLLNPNNLAGYSNLGAFCGLGLLASRRSLLPRALVASGTICCMSITLFSASRSGVLTLALGLVALGISWGRIPGMKRSTWNGLRAWRALFPLLTIALAAAGFALLGANGEMYRDLFSDDLSKLEQVSALAPAVQDYFWVGAGRGAFETLGSGYLSVPLNIVHRKAENFLLSWAIEWGALPALMALGSLGALLLPARANPRQHRPAHAALVAIVVFATQNLLDLGMEMLGLCVAWFAIFGALDGSRDFRSSTPSPPPRAPWVGPVSLAAAVALALGMSALALARGPDVFSERRQLSAWVDQSPALSWEKAHERLLTASQKRPAEPHYGLVGASLALRLDKPALPWAALALARSPDGARAQLATAEGLLQLGALTQAMIHFKRALEIEPQLVGDVAERLSTLRGQRNLFLKAAPPGAVGARLLLNLRNRSASAGSALQRQLLKDAQARAPSDALVLSQTGFALLHEMKQQGADCSPQPCPPRPRMVEQVQKIAAQLSQSSTCDKWRMQARILELQGHTGQAVALLKECLNCSVPAPCMKERALLAQALNNPEERKRAEDSYLAVVCSDSPSCASAELWLAELAQARGDWHSTHYHFARAAGRVPSGETWLKAARAAARAGLLARAEVAYHHASELGQTDAPTKKLLEQAHRDALRRASP